tara:strand:- start:2815 stop:3681 length:867 start_codon:yes stop_codon:yes gene_type:complete
MKIQLTPSSKIGIVGLGLIGGSLGLSLQKLGFEVHGVTHKQISADRAQERGLANLISTDLNILKDCKVIFIALPLEKLLSPDQDLIKALPVNAVITDVGSVKAPVLKVWQNLHPYFVPSHPMAGTNNSGVEAGTASLFHNKLWVSTPNATTNHEALEIVKNIAISLGCKWITADAMSHDQAVALISHLPVLVSAALISTASNQGEEFILSLCKSLASSGFEDTSRVGGGNPELGMSMVKHNYSAVINSLNSYQKVLNKFQDLILSKEWESLHEELKKTNIQRPDFINH